MSSPFQQKFSEKSPFRKEGVVTLSEQDIKNAKSASPEPPKEISFEGQGGKDYENRPEDAINPEGQGGIDYEAKDYKKKTKESPLNNYYNPQGEIYLSDMPAFQQLQSDITGLAAAVANESDANKAERLQSRVDRRMKRSYKKGGRPLRGDERTLDKDGNKVDNKAGGMGIKTLEIQQRANEAKESAQRQAEARKQKKFSDYLNDNPKASNVEIKAYKDSLGI